MEELIKNVDATTKAVALFISCALIWAFSYNVGVLFGPRFYWIHVFSIADHVSTAIFFAPILCIVAIVGVPFLYFLNKISPAIPRFKITPTLLVFSIAATFVYFLDADLIGMVLISMILAIVTMVAAIEGFKRARASFTTPEKLRVVFILLLSVGSIDAALFGAMTRVPGREALRLVNIEIANGSFIQGTVIRLLDAGVLMEQVDHNWILVPKSEVRKITTITRAAAPPSAAR